VGLDRVRSTIRLGRFESREVFVRIVQARTKPYEAARDASISLKVRFVALRQDVVCPLVNDLIAVAAEARVAPIVREAVVTVEALNARQE
jgi:hypothetical protein